MKLSKKTNLYLMLLVYLFAYYCINLTIWIVSDLFESPNNSLIITSSFLFKKSIFPLFFWIYSLLEGKLVKQINSNYENKNLL
jgi:hypothetical protein